MNIKKHLSILYIEDDEIMALKLKSILEKIFYEVIIAKNGQEAYAIFKGTHKIDLIISDINMPKMDGLEFLEKVREIDENIPFIFLTGRNESKKMLRAIELSITNYLLKPIDLDKLLLAINKILEKKIKDQDLLENDLIINKDYSWNKSKNILYKNNIIIKLTKKELQFIGFLLSSPNRIYSESDIIDYIWKDEFSSLNYSSNLKNLIVRLKKKIPDLKIINHYGLGYKIEIN
ncbi:hypothetical protein LPB137_04345 [Poseidonibacter parvus]|uniref:DNA-binding response regulator n=1 Tax=Poseidonibacter parvus TaxID=1850254 RepID=A0A1P8KKQ2_9BACT|nr:response regulator transcription factor [Poseidonibacter parvus]APW65124.1 hypothetical protein LPB137_04345 [Poseidonibacter parvus]